MTPANVRDAVEPMIERAGLIVDDLIITTAGKRRIVRVIVDLPEDQVGAVDLDTVAEVSSALARALDDSDVMGAASYVLEVTSPGVDRPLTQRRHWRRAMSRLVSVTAQGEKVTGRVSAVDERGVTLDVDRRLRQVAWADLGTGRMQVEFSRATTSDGADAPGEET